MCVCVCSSVHFHHRCRFINYLHNQDTELFLAEGQSLYLAPKWRWCKSNEEKSEVEQNMPAEMRGLHKNSPWGLKSWS